MTERRRIRRVLFGAVSSVVAILHLAQLSAFAQCSTFDRPAKARRVSMSLVRAHSQCDGVFTFPSPNTQTSAGVAACAPPTPVQMGEHCSFMCNDVPTSVSDYSFGPKGACRVTIEQAVSRPCHNPVSEPECLSLVARVRCSDLRDADDNPAGPPGNSAHWLLQTVVRITAEDGGPLTLLDIPSDAALDVSNGTISDKVEMLNFGIPFPSCAQVEIVKMHLQSPDGHIFAKPGSSARP